MVFAKTLNLLNFSLALLIIILTANLFGLRLPSLGRTIYSLDPAEPLCLVNSGDSPTLWNDLDRCCLEARRQVECLPQLQQSALGSTTWTCQSGPGGISEIWLNAKAYQYCRLQPVW